MRPEVVKLTLDTSRDASAPRAMITNRSGATWILGCHRTLDRQLFRRCGRSAYLEAWVGDEVDLICAADDPEWAG